MRLGFGDFIFDSETRELLRDRQPATLTPKAFQLLEILIEHRPKALSKSRLHDRLWPNTFVVEANLSNLVGEVRRALDDDPRRPQFVRTVHRFGYAFCAETADLSRRETTGVVCRVIWTGGSTTLGDGDHIIGRDPAAGDLPRFAERVPSPWADPCHERSRHVRGSRQQEWIGGPRPAGRRHRSTE
jgi:DNA-binding winged helix-turn-helix (wHTH) protein